MAQTDTEFKNLKVLQRDISKPELMKLMKSFTWALGVRCRHCHYSEPGQPFNEIDFPSDKMPAKDAARTMLGMVEAINSQYLPKVSTEGETPHKINCATCQRGFVEPRTTEEALQDAYAQGGIDTTIADYRRLREEFYGSGGYDFGEWAVSTFASELAEDGAPAEALKLLDMNAEFYPESEDITSVKAMVYMEMGDKDAAITELEAILKKNPENRRAKRQLEHLRQP